MRLFDVLRTTVQLRHVFYLKEFLKKLLESYPDLVVCVVLVHDAIESGLVHGTDNVSVQQLYKLHSLALGEVPTEAGYEGALYKLGVPGTLFKRPQALLCSLSATWRQRFDEILETHLVGNLLVVNGERLTSKHLY